MRPAAVPALPPEDGLGGAGVVYELKLDGFRCLAFARGRRPPYLQSRSGRDLCAEFPAIADAVARLPEGLVLDAELVAWQGGRFAFGELLRTPAARDADGVVLGLIAFDVLALPGGRDVRRLPLADRRRLLSEVLADVPPPVQAVLATGSRAEALSWSERLADSGVEGIVCKSLASAYRARGAGRAWVKYRPGDTTDATVTGFTGTPGRPRALLLRLADGTTVLGSPQLTPVQARQVAEAAAGLLDEPRTDPEHGTVHPLRSPLRAEVRIGTGRASGARFVRLRGD
ncbi:DNA ligase [Kitasatospora sp. NPDC057223]|uniref:ATP-dependent DNA ligase n=1 Tax=Kitasatospora sp. NPDC057223 TaxID=3346055 RepID=UPI00363F5A81